MRRVQLIHWHVAEAKELAKHIKAAGYKVDYEMPKGMDFFASCAMIFPLRW